MKTFFVTAALLVASYGFAQKHSSLSQSIHENENKLTIKIKGDIDGKKVDYYRTFNITGFSKQQREELKERVFDSLGIAPPAAPVAPAPPAVAAPTIESTPPEPPVAATAPEIAAAPSVKLTAPPKAPKAPGAPSVHATPAPEPAVVPAPTISISNEYEETAAVSGNNPYIKEIKYNRQTGILYMKYRFKKNGEENVFEKSVELKDASKSKRDEIIRNYEAEIGLPANKL
ncbi:lipoprotein 17-related variable surface protein [Foetidibacter luteolus]|uniref:lipoprotein 17-related variable surface protein n=1 Tax=Foetidibacter luteolus TaxID=2608880 RepID=UPI00129AF3E5|nr:lipoprotein 17-related variable surface protein [Foetidibacter luteolus]